MRRALSIRTQVLSLCAALLLIAAAGQLLFGTFFARTYFLQQNKAEIENFFGYIRENYPGDNPAQLYELLREGEDIQNIRVAIYDASGALIYTSRPMGEGYGVEPFFPVLGDGIPFSREPEALELPGRPVLGVQFPPERMAFGRRRPDTVDGGAIFQRYLSLCKGK